MEYCQDLRKKVLRTLELLKLEHFEVMFIWMYKRNEIMTEKTFVRSNNDEGESKYVDKYAE